MGGNFVDHGSPQPPRPTNPYTVRKPCSRRFICAWCELPAPLPRAYMSDRAQNALNTETSLTGGRARADAAPPDNLADRPTRTIAERSLRDALGAPSRARLRACTPPHCGAARTTKRRRAARHMPTASDTISVSRFAQPARRRPARAPRAWHTSPASTCTAGGSARPRQRLSTAARAGGSQHAGRRLPGGRRPRGRVGAYLGG